MKTQPFQLLGYDEMSNMPPQTWLVEGLLFEGTAALMYGRSNAFKSFLAIDIACSVATGRNWHGAPVAKGAVVYVATEGANGVGRARIPAWMDHYGIPAHERANIWLSRSELALDQCGSVENLIREVSSRTGVGRCALVVLDIFASTMEGSEISDDTARKWLSGVQRIVGSTGATVLAIAHCGWQDQSRARMHSHFWGSFDTRLGVRGDGKKRQALITVDRHKEADSAGVWGFQLDPVSSNAGYSSLAPRHSKDVAVRMGSTKGPSQADRALNVLRTELEIVAEAHPDFGPDDAQVLPMDAWRKACERHKLTDSDKPGARQKAFSRAKNDLLEEGRIGADDEFVWLTD